MRTLTLLLLGSLFFNLKAQVNNRTETDCNGNSASIYGVLGQGKALIVASKGLDCSICRGQAPGLQSWAAANQAQVEVWGAMVNTYSSQSASCNAIQAWVSQYNWNNIFAFADQDDHYFAFGTPRYLVFSPQDSTMIYSGSSQNAARSAALNAALPGLGQAELSQKEEWSWSLSGRRLRLQNLPENAQEFRLYNLGGQEVFRAPAREALELNGLPSGVYLLALSTTQGAQSVRKVILP